MAYGDELTGIGGWMWIFLFGFAFTGPLMLVLGSYGNLYGDPNVAAMLGSRWLVYQIAEWALVVAALAIIGFIVWRLFNVRNRRTVRLTIIAIPVLAIGMTLVDILVTVAIAQVDAGLLFSELGVDLFRGVIYSAVWCSYFNVSKRVQNTYVDRETDETLLIFE